jgi:hypothetical protein
MTKEDSAITDASDLERDPLMSNKLYDTLKFIAQIFLPALGTLYYTLADIWHLAKALEVVGTISAIDVFLGLLLGLSTLSYNKSGAKYDGAIEIEEDDEAKRFSLSLNSDPNELEKKKDVTFKVKKGVVNEH